MAPSEVPLTELPENDPETSAVNVAVDPVTPSSRMGLKFDKQGFKHAVRSEERSDRFYVRCRCGYGVTCSGGVVAQ